MATIIQKIVFRNTKSESLYELYMNSKLHSLITNGPVEITDIVGSSFTAFNGYITGKNLKLVKNKLIVQSWRGSDWDAKEADSAFIISLDQRDNDTVLNMIHANVPDEQAKSLDKGWHDHYWNPWKQHLAGKKITRPVMDH